MSEKIRVSIEYEDASFEVRVIFDNNNSTEKICREINNFWGGSEDRLNNANDCIYQCVTRMIADEIIKLQMRTSLYCGVEAAIKAFSEGIEGFYPIDGSYGIKLDYCDDFELEYLYVQYKKEDVK